MLFLWDDIWDQALQSAVPGIGRQHRQDISSEQDPVARHPLHGGGNHADEGKHQHFGNCANQDKRPPPPKARRAVVGDHADQRLDQHRGHQPPQANIAQGGAFNGFIDKLDQN